MNGRIPLLAGLLLVQLLLVGWLVVGRDGDSTGARLLDFDLASVTAVQVDSLPESANLSAVADEAETEGTSAAASQVRLQRGDGGWRIGTPSSGEAASSGKDEAVDEGAPANAEKVDELLERLSRLDSAWPVGTTGEARERFAVTEDGYRKRLVLERGEAEPLVLFLGTSPGFKRLHARRADDDAVFSIPLSDFDLPATADDWLDKALLSASGEIVRLKREGAYEVALVAGSSGEGNSAPRSWSLSALGTGPLAEVPGVADPEAVALTLGRFKGLRVIGRSDLNTSGVVTDRFTLETDLGDEIRYDLYENSEQDRFALAREGVPGTYEIAGYLAEQLRQSAVDLELPAEDEAADGEAGTSATAGEAAEATDDVSEVGASSP